MDQNQSSYQNQIKLKPVTMIHHRFLVVDFNPPWLPLTTRPISAETATLVMADSWPVRAARGVGQSADSPTMVWVRAFQCHSRTVQSSEPLKMTRKSTNQSINTRSAGHWTWKDQLITWSDVAIRGDVALGSTQTRHDTKMTVNNLGDFGWKIQSEMHSHLFCY